MVCPNLPTPQFLFFVPNVSTLIYYSHIPTTLAALAMGLFVYFRSGRTLVSRVLLAITVVFSLWTLCDLIVWTSNDSATIMFVWSLFGILSAALSLLCVYFVYVFIDQRDISPRVKVIFTIFMLPLLVLTPTGYNVSDFYLNVCGVSDGGLPFTEYYYAIGFIAFFWILFVLGSRLAKSEVRQSVRQQIVLMGVGIEFFLLAFFLSGFLISYLVSVGYIKDFGLEQYGLIGMPVFLFLLGYLIVRYHLFNIKLLAVQALVATLAFLIGAQLFFVRTGINFVLTQLTLVLVLIVGYILIKSVGREIERKEELQRLADRLAIANENLRVLDTAKSEFISIASHQLRTPLTSIKGFVSLILEGSYGHVPQKIEDALNKIYASNERLIRLVEDLLNLSRIESGRMEYRIEPTHIEDALRELEDSFQITAKQKGLRLALHLPEAPLPLVLVDFFKFREVASNLIDNALKYTPKGAVDIGVEVNPDGKSVRVSVADTGIGVPPNEISALFQKFSRGKDTSRLHANGSGLGLYLGKELVEAMHGRIWLESAGEGTGTTFFVELPTA